MDLGSLNQKPQTLNTKKNCMELLVSTCVFHNPFPENSLTKMLLKFVLANRATILCPLHLSMKFEEKGSRHFEIIFWSSKKQQSH